jgi:hypothetical protein
MRVFGTIGALVLVASVASAQTPAAKPAAAKAPAAAARTSGYPAVGSLNQLMRGVLFPNANILFDAQSNDPGAPSTKKNAEGGGASATFANVYKGWQVVEGAAAALGSISNELLRPGRKCENGLPVPINRPEFRKGAEQLAAAGKLAMAAANAKSQDKVIEVTDAVAEACATCHTVFRDVGDGTPVGRCK